jgi:hypothetical protein
MELEWGNPENRPPYMGGKENRSARLIWSLFHRIEGLSTVFTDLSTVLGFEASLIKIHALLYMGVIFCKSKMEKQRKKIKKGK